MQHEITNFKVCQLIISYYIKVLYVSLVAKIISEIFERIQECVNCTSIIGLSLLYAVVTKDLTFSPLNTA